jgi:hypothetical protein
MYFKVTSTVSGGLTATRQLTIAPDTISRLMFIENATTGDQSITIKQGSGGGAAVTIPNGDTKAVILPGSGSGSIVLDAFASLSVVDLNVSGNLDVDGTANLDAVDIDGAVQIDNTVSVGVNDTGYDVKFFGDTASAFMLWDASADDLILGGAAGLSVNSAALVTGVLTTTAATVFNGGFAAGGVGTFADGSASAPSITNTGDLDTGIAFPAENSIAISTAGTQRLIIDSAGFFDVTATGNDVARFSGANSGSITIRNDTANQVIMHTSTSDDLVFGTGGNNDRLTIAAAGNVGINEASPDNTLHVNSGGTNIAAKFESTDSIAGILLLDNGGNVELTASGSTFQVQPAGGVSTFSVNSSSVFTPTAGTSNTRLGLAAGDAIDSGAAYNVLIGDQAGSAISTGDFNTAVGFQSLLLEDEHGHNTAIGYRTLKALNAGAHGYNTAVGSDAGLTMNTGHSNTLIGSEAGNKLQDGLRNVAVGNASGYTNVSGVDNTHVGFAAGFLSTGTRNTFVGARNDTYGVGQLMTTGNNNTFLGAFSGNVTGLDLRTSSNNIVLADGDGNPRHFINASLNHGFSSIDFTTSNGSVGNIYAYEAASDNIVNVYHLNTATRNAIFEARRNGRTAERMAQINIGENASAQGTVSVFSSTANGGVGGGVTLANGATSWSSASDIRLKTVTGKYDNALQDIAKIEPIKFTWKSDSTNQANVGVSAQSVQEVVPEAVSAQANTLTPDDETEYLNVKYTELIPLMIASIQELSAKNDALEARIATLEG